MGTELQGICDTILTLLDGSLVPGAKDAESKVFYHKMKGDYYRYIAEFTDGDKKSAAANKAKSAYDDAMGAASELAVTHPIRLGLALNFSVFHYEVLSNPDEACKMARTAFEDAIAELDNSRRRATRTQRSSCSCCVTISRCGRQTRRETRANHSLDAAGLYINSVALADASLIGEVC